MSIQDVCDLSSLLQVDEMEKSNLHNKILADEANIKVQEGRLQHELEEKNRVFGLRMKVADKAKTVLHNLELHSLSILENNTSNSAYLPSAEVKEFKLDVKRYLDESFQMKKDSVDLLALLVRLGSLLAEQEKESLSSLKNKLEQEQRIQDNYVAMSEEKLPKFKEVEEKLKQLNQQMTTLKENIETKKSQLIEENQRMASIESESKSIESEAQKLINNARQEKKEFDSKLVLSTDMLEKAKKESQRLTTGIEEIKRHQQENNNDDVLKENSDLDSKLVQMKSQRLELTEELKKEQESLQQNQSKLNNFQGEFKLLSKEMENDLLKEKSLLKKSVFTDTTDNLQKQLEEKRDTCLGIKNELSSINTELNETTTANITNVELKALLISIEENERRKFEIIQKLKNQELHKDIAGDEIVQRMECIMQQKLDIQNSIININTQINDATLRQNKLPLLESEIAKHEAKLKELRRVSQEIIERTQVEVKLLETEQLKMTQSKKREDEIWIAHEIESRFNAEIATKTKEQYDAIQKLQSDLKIEDEKFVLKVREAEEKNEREFLENRAKYLTILNELSTLGNNPFTLQDELMLEKDSDEIADEAVKSEIQLKKPTSKPEKSSSKPFLKDDVVPIENRSRLRLTSQSNSLTNAQKPTRVPKVKSQGRENLDPSQSKKYGASQAKKTQQSWLDSDDDDDVFGANAFKASQGPRKK